MRVGHWGAGSGAARGRARGFARGVGRGVLPRGILAVVVAIGVLGGVGTTPAAAAAPLRWASCAGSGWYPDDHAQSFDTTGGERRSSPGTLVCPLQLPDGATIRTVEFHVRDADPGTNVNDCLLLRSRVVPATGEIQAITTPRSTGARLGAATLTASPTKGAVVKNKNWAYALSCVVHDATSQGIRGAAVGYVPPSKLGTTRWANCGPWGFFPSNDGLDWHRQTNARYLTDPGQTTGFGYMHCAMAVPHAASLTLLLASLVDATSSIDVLCGAFRSSLTAATSVSTLSSGRIVSNGVPGSYVRDDGRPDRPAVDDRGFAYWVECTGGRSAVDGGIIGTAGLTMSFTPKASSTRWVSCHGLGFRPSTSGIAYSDMGRGAGSGRFVDPAPAWLQCRLDLPDGWRMTESRFVVWDAEAGDGADVTVGPCRIRRSSLATGSASSVSSPTSTTGLTLANVLRDASLVDATIDQQRYGYWAECWMPGSSGTLAIFGATVRVVR